MQFKTDAQRKAVFARLSNRFSHVSTGSSIADAVVNLYPSSDESVGNDEGLIVEKNLGISFGDRFANAIAGLYPEPLSSYDGAVRRDDGIAGAVVGLYPDVHYDVPVSYQESFAKKPDYERLKDRFKDRLPAYLVNGLDFEEIYDNNLSYEDNVKKFEKQHAVFLNSNFSADSDKSVRELDIEFRKLKKELYERNASESTKDREEISAMVKRLDQLDELQKRKERSREDRFSVKDDVKKLIAVGGFRLNPSAEKYYDALDDIESNYGDRGVRDQALNIVTHLDAVNDEQRGVIERLKSIGNEGTNIERSASVNINIDEMERKKLVNSFMDFSKDKFNNDRKIDMGVFESFAARNNIPIEEALIANDWVEEALTPDAASAVKDAWNKVNVRGVGI